MVFVKKGLNSVKISQLRQSFHSEALKEKFINLEILLIKVWVVIYFKTIN